MGIIPFYGTEQPDLFRIERESMDRAGHLIAALDARLPQGRILDVGAGNGWTARRLASATRAILPLEPARAMVDLELRLPWVQGAAEHLPFADDSFAGAYATWAYFFTRGWDPRPGLRELDRVVAPGGPLLIADNAGGDAFCALAPEDISADAEVWAEAGFAMTVIESAFEFDAQDDAERLLGAFFGDAGVQGAALRVSFNIALFSGRSLG